VTASVHQAGPRRSPAFRRWTVAPFCFLDWQCVQIDAERDSRSRPSRVDFRDASGGNICAIWHAQARGTAKQGLTQRYAVAKRCESLRASRRRLALFPSQFRMCMEVSPIVNQQRPQTICCGACRAGDAPIGRKRRAGRGDVHPDSGAITDQPLRARCQGVTIRSISDAARNSRMPISASTVMAANTRAVWICDPA
jgi:hypothetical protein